MNIEKERELFLYEIDGHGYIFENMKWLGNCFEDHFLNMVWELWLASANREGYKLVPVEPTYEMIENAIGYDGHIESIYKAMIGAAE